MQEAKTTDDHYTRPTQRQAAFDVFAVIVLVPVASIGAAVVMGWLSAGPPSLAAVVLAQAVLVLGGVYVLLERRGHRFESMGLVPLKRRDFPRALLIVLASFAVNVVLTLVIVASSPGTLEEHLAGLESVALGLTTDAPLVATIALLLLVGFYEEIVARGLLLTRLREMLGGFWLPAVVSSLLFALGHFYQGFYGVVQTALLGFVLAVFTLRWGTLWPAIFAHAAVNIVSVLQLRELSAPVG